MTPPKDEQTKYVALLRAINVGKGRPVPMTKVVTIFSDLGCTNVATYIQSGNIVFGSPDTQVELSKQIQLALSSCFGFAIPTIVLRHNEFAALNPPDLLTQAVESQPKMVHAIFSKVPVPQDIVANLSHYALNNEKTVVEQGQLWVYYENGVGKSKITPAVLDRLMDAPCTSRNFNTVLALGKM